MATGSSVTGRTHRCRRIRRPYATAVSLFLNKTFTRSGCWIPTTRWPGSTATGRSREAAPAEKALLDVCYLKPQAGLRTELFVKLSRDFDDPVRDRGRTQMAAEVAFAALAGIPGFPIALPAAQFADYHRDSGSGILVRERISKVSARHCRC